MLKALKLIFMGGIRLSIWKPMLCTILSFLPYTNPRFKIVQQQGGTLRSTDEEVVVFDTLRSQTE